MRLPSRLARSLATEPAYCGAYLAAIACKGMWRAQAADRVVCADWTMRERTAGRWFADEARFRSRRRAGRDAQFGAHGRQTLPREARAMRKVDEAITEIVTHIHVRARSGEKVAVPRAQLTWHNESESAMKPAPEEEASEIDGASSAPRAALRGRAALAAALAPAA